MAVYESEFTQFMRNFLTEHPEVDAERLIRRAIWWDRPLDDDFENKAKNARVKQRGYYYQYYVYPNVLPDAAEAPETTDKIREKPHGFL